MSASGVTRGRKHMTKLAAVLILAPLACAQAGSGAAPSGAAAPDARATTTVRPGVEHFVETPPAIVRGKRIGLITNHSGIDRQRRSSIDLIRAMTEVKLVALFSPEHGIRGVDDARVGSTTDEKSG